MDNLPHYHFSFQRNQLKNDIINAIKEAMKMSSNKFYSQSVCHATFVHTYITFYISSILHVKRFIILHVIRFI